MQQARFADMGNSILGRMDDMGTRMDELEQSIASLLDQAGLDRDVLSSPQPSQQQRSVPMRSPISAPSECSKQTLTAQQRIVTSIEI